MADADRAASAGMTAGAETPLARLAAAPFGWSFFQALRLLEAVHRDRPRFARSVRPAQDAVRLAQEASVVFAPATLAGWEEAEEARPARLLENFFGLFGSDGPLPLHLTEYARDRRRNQRDAAFERFADIFHHRACRSSIAPGPTPARPSASTGRKTTGSPSTPAR